MQNGNWVARWVRDAHNYVDCSRGLVVIGLDTPLWGAFDASFTNFQYWTFEHRLFALNRLVWMIALYGWTRVQFGLWRCYFFWIDDWFCFIRFFGFEIIYWIEVVNFWKSKKKMFITQVFFLDQIYVSKRTKNNFQDFFVPYILYV